MEDKKLNSFDEFIVKYPDGVGGEEGKYAINVLTITKLFRGENKLSIPSYQRPYSWTDKEVNELINDLVKTLKDQKKWFCGPIFTSQENFQDSHQLLLDGQQRITTIFLILRSICVAEFLVSSEEFDNLPISRGENIKTNNDSLIEVYKQYNRLQKLIRKTILIEETDSESFEETNSSKFQTEKTIREKFNDFMVSLINVDRKSFDNYKTIKVSSDDKYAPTLIQINKNLEVIYDRLNKELRKTDGLKYIVDLGKHILNNLIFIRIPLMKKGDVLDIFETLNSRGKPLALTDLIRFKSLKQIPQEKSEELEKVWAEIFYYTGKISEDFKFFTSADVFFERLINSVCDQPDGIKNQKERIDEFEKRFGPNYIDSVKSILKILKSWNAIFNYENGIIKNFKDKSRYKSLIHLLGLSLKINVNSQFAFISYLKNIFDLESFEDNINFTGGFSYEIEQQIKTTFALTNFHNVRSNSTRRIFLEISRSLRNTSADTTKLWYDNFNSSNLKLDFESSFFPTDKFKVSINDFSGLKNLIFSKNTEQEDVIFNLSIFHFITGGGFPSKDHYEKNHLDHIMPQKWFNNPCWSKQNQDGENELKESIEKLNDSKIRDVLISFYEQEELWSSTTYANSFIQLIGNKFQIVSKVNIEKSNNYWNECESNSGRLKKGARLYLKNEFEKDINVAWTIPSSPLIYDYEEFNIKNIIDRSEEIIKTIVSRFNERYSVS